MVIIVRLYKKKKALFGLGRVVYTRIKAEIVHNLSLLIGFLPVVEKV